MSHRNHRRCALALIALTLAAPSAPAANIADLRSDWSNSANPNANANGAWAYTESFNPLPAIASWAGASTVSGWGPAGNVPGNFLPFYYRATPETVFGADMFPGDVTVHSTDGFNGGGNGPAIVTWTSAVSGTFTIHGMFWPLRMIGRSNDVDLVLVHNGNSTPLGSLFIPEDGSVTRCNPARFNLTNVSIVSGDVLQLSVVRVSAAGDFVGLNLAVSTGPCPSTPGDINNDGAVNGFDIAQFTNCLINGTTGCGICACADMDGNNTINAADVPLLINSIL